MWIVATCPKLEKYLNHKQNRWPDFWVYLLIFFYTYNWRFQVIKLVFMFNIDRTERKIKIQSIFINNNQIHSTVFINLYINNHFCHRVRFHNFFVLCSVLIKSTFFLPLTPTSDVGGAGGKIWRQAINIYTYAHTSNYHTHTHTHSCAPLHSAALIACHQCISITRWMKIYF